MYRKSNMETCITICKIDSHREFAVWLRNSNRGSGALYQPGKREGGSCKTKKCLRT